MSAARKITATEAKALREQCIRSGSVLPDKHDPKETAIAGRGK